MSLNVYPTLAKKNNIVIMHMWSACALEENLYLSIIGATHLC